MTPKNVANSYAYTCLYTIKIYLQYLNNNIQIHVLELFLTLKYILHYTYSIRVFVPVTYIPTLTIQYIL